MRHDDAFDSLEHAEAAKEPDPCQHVVMPVRFVDEEPAPKPCPCRSHDCEVDGIDAAYERFTSEWSESIYSKQPKPATNPGIYYSDAANAAWHSGVFAGIALTAVVAVASIIIGFAVVAILK